MADEKKFDYIEQNGQKFIHVSTISTVDANTQFMQNVQLVGQQRQALIELDKHKKAALTDAEKNAADAKIKEISESLTKNNELMAKTYGYSLTRNYLHQIVKTRIFLKLTDEEYSKAQGDENVPADQILVKGDIKYRLIAEIPAADANTQFRQNVQLVQVQRERLVKMTEALKSMTDGDAKTKLEAEAKTAEETLVKNNEAMIKQYGFSLTRDYLMEVAESKLYTQVNEEEFLKAKAQSEAQAAE